MDPERVYTMRIALRGALYESREQLLSFTHRLLPQLQAIPGIESAALASTIPYSGGRSSSAVTLEGRPEPPPGELFVVQMESVTADFHKTLHIPLRNGRLFDSRDGDRTPLVGIVNEAFVRHQFPKENPIGKRIKVGTYQANVPWITIVGVAGDVRHNNVDRTVRPLLYRPLAQIPPRAFYAVIRTRGDANAVAAPARAAVYSVDATQPVYRPQSYQKAIDQHMTGIGYVASTMAVSGVLALILSIVGVYGVMSYSVTERTHEIGVRMALGAAQHDVQWQVVRAGLALTGIGLVIGLALAAGLARLLSGLIFGVSATDLTSFAGVTLLLVVSAGLACWIPARRASRVDPMIALRNE
jgi:putative ABC transport system permease protein